eukprot:CAMPEP_0194026304 /NCGR_PEP_ID=MMETSP0009_2-20130614/630_1 /TAXON_ID=210454 /ORGANISM="Grammatophora oceanica, Strain CCMP 410" /LENGTH=348 /DNA_ID=CAMNT_0038664935 /DNA_START=16 /DNA_END=1062 /DNA_ORIENTATION=-
MTATMTAPNYLGRIYYLILVLLVCANGFRVEPSLRPSPRFAGPKTTPCSSKSLTQSSSSCSVRERRLSLSPRLQMAAAVEQQQGEIEERKRRWALRRFFGRCIRLLPTKSNARSLAKRVRRSITIFVLGLLMSNAALMSPGVPTQPAFAASTATVPNIERIIPKGTKVETMIDRYVVNHMFDDDVYDPVEATLREIVDDKTTQSYPIALKSIEAEVYGRDVSELLEEAKQNEKADKGGDSSAGSVEQVVEKENVVEKIAFFWTNKFGLPAAYSILITMATFLFVIPMIGFNIFMTFAKANRNRVFKRFKRTYGDEFGKSMKAKKDPEVTLDDDDDDDVGGGTDDKKKD